MVFHIEELHLSINKTGERNGKGQQYELRTAGRGGGGRGKKKRKQKKLTGLESGTESIIGDSVCHVATNFYTLL